MATTRGVTFSAKIRTLTDFHLRIATGQQLSNAEIITTLRYFQQTLVGFLKELPAENSVLFEQFNADAQRSTFYPNLNYSGLFYGIVNLLDAFPLLTSGQTDIGQAILDTLKALYFFLDKDCIDQLPYLVASQLGVFPNELNKKIVYLLADCIVPYSLGEHASGSLSVPVVLMLVLQQSSDSSLHTLIIESLMARRENVYHDLLAVIAKGTSESRIPAANLLFHYWPLINPAIIHRKPIQYKVQAWSFQPCQNQLCTEKSHSTRRSYDPVVCAKYADTAPPISLCHKCCTESTIETTQPLRFICQPMAASTSTICQNKACESSNRIAVATCFAEDCIRSHGYVPLRLCQECFVALHSNPIAESHIRHKGMVCAWGTTAERNMIEAVVKLLKETSCQLEGNEGEAKRPKWLRQLEGGQVLGKDIDAMADERRMLSRFGVWMMAALCPPTLDAPPHAVGYIMSMVFQWFATTALLPNDSMGSTIEQLKTDFASDWVNLAISNHYDILVSILLPDLPEYAQVGGIWDKWCSRKEQMKEGLSKLLSLMPYDVISFQTWNSVIPHWLQAISQEVEEEDLLDLKVLLCKIFEPDLCPLPFEQNKVFEFVSMRLNSGVYENIIQALDWLHLLSRINIRISLHMLLDIFSESLQSMRQSKIASKIEENDLEEDGPLAIEVIMVDVIAQQVNLNEINPYEITSVTDQMFSTSALLLQYLDESEGSVQQRHSCQNPETDQFLDCQRCQQSAFLYQVLMHLTEQICPKDEIKIECDTSNMNDWLAETQLTDSLSSVSQLSNLTSPRNASFQGALSPLAKEEETKEGSDKAFHFLTSTSPKTAMFDEETSRDEFVGVLPSEEIETATAQATTLTERDVGYETCQILQTTLVDSLKNTPTQPLRPRGSRTEFWDTSVGRFRFQLQQLPASLRFIHSLVMNIGRETDPDVQYFILNILKYLCLHCEALNNARREHRGFLIWIQENFLIPRLWTMLRSEFTQVGQLAVPLLIHAITLPCGEEVFWSTVNAEFTNEKWEVRFKAVERVYVLAHMILVAPVKANRLLQTCLSCAFSHLVVSAYDPNAAVAQRAILALKAMPSSSLNLMCVCFESQFDFCILDRPLIISRINLLTTLVPEENILTWDFFIQRFETLALEAQLKCHVGDSTFVQDLLHTDPMSELYQRKVTKARQSLNEADSVRSIVKSLRDNSLKHQLTMNAKVDKEQRQKAHSTMVSRGRRGATTDLTRLKLRKVLVMVRVSMAFRSITDRISSSINVIRSRAASPDPSAQSAGGIASCIAAASAGAMGETAQIVAAAAVAGGLAVEGSAAPASTSFSLEPTDDHHTSTFNASYAKSGGSYSRLREFTDEESNLCLLLNRVVDMENPERHTVYLTIALFVRFLCNKKGGPTDEKASAKKQSVLLRYFNTLLGYSNSEKCFTIPPSRLRKAAVSNAFLTGLPEILDNNLMIGNQMLPLIGQFLLHLPSAQKFASDHSSADYSLRLLDQPSRHSWLHTLILILYKYRCDTPPISDAIRKLILVVISTLECHCHVCGDPSDFRQTEFNLHSDTSDEEEASNVMEEKTTIKEEEDDQENVKLAETHIRPESLKFAKNQSSTTQEVKFSTEIRGPKFIQPSIIEPVKSPESSASKSVSIGMALKRGKKRNKKKQQRPPPPERVRISCTYCNEILETFEEESISLCLIALSTFMHREPAMAAPTLFRIITVVTRFIDTPQFPWHDTNVFVPGNSKSTAKQLIRVILHQLSSSGIALQLFDSKVQNINSFWSTISFSLADFNELNPVSFMQCLIEDVLESWPHNLARILHNLAAYVSTIPCDSYLTYWSTTSGLFEAFFRRYHTQLLSDNLLNNNNNNNNSATKATIQTEIKSSAFIMTTILRVQNFSTFKTSVSLVESYSKWLAEVLHHCKADLRDLLAVCTACNRALTRERDKQCISRSIVSELIQAIKFKVELAEKNYMAIVDLVLQDFGELHVEEDTSEEIKDADQFNTAASEAVRPFMNDILEFIADLHNLSKLKKQTNSDRIGGDLKAGLAEIVALEMSRPAVRDSRTVMRFIPWLYSPPSLTAAAPSAFAESVTNVRILSWILVGCLHASPNCLPVPINCSNQMADYIHFVLAGFADQSKQSVVHMSALFHAFHLCQLWTIYCERVSSRSEDFFSKAMENILDFWSRVTPAILQLLSHSKVLADMVNLHFVNTMQALQQCNSAVLCQLYPMWQPVLTVYHSQIPSQLRSKLDACENQPPLEPQPITSWLKKVRYKISQIELQTSAASPFYNV